MSIENDIELLKAENDDIRATIEVAQMTYDFIDSLDPDGPEVLRWGLKTKLRRAKRRCLEIICNSIDELAGEDSQTNEEEVAE